jgi:hypothetical protein
VNALYTPGLLDQECKCIFGYTPVLLDCRCERIMGTPIPWKLYLGSGVQYNMGYTPGLVGWGVNTYLRPLAYLTTIGVKAWVHPCIT